jgi:Rrf2 family transcriptional regulator, iron-sulfur cluster assembly transcription factor
MRLSTRGRFAITAMIDLALREDASPVPLQDLALRHRISLSYLEQVFAKLRQNSLVESTRGPGGGYTLGLPSDNISVADIIGAVEDSGSNPTKTKRDSSSTATDMTQGLWDALHTTVLTHMKTISLRSLAAEQRARGFQVQSRNPRKKGVYQKAEEPSAPQNVPNSVFALGRVWPARS